MKEDIREESAEEHDAKPSDGDQYIIVFKTDNLEQFQNISGGKYVCFEIPKDFPPRMLEKMSIDLIRKIML